MNSATSISPTLAAIGLMESALADAMAVTRNFVSELRNDHRPVIAPTALIFATRVWQYS